MSVVTKPVVWIPTRIHPNAFQLAIELFDVITPDDPRAENWWEYAEGSVVRTGGISESELEKAHKLKIISRNGAFSLDIPIYFTILSHTDDVQVRATRPSRSSNALNAA